MHSSIALVSVLTANALAATIPVMVGQSGLAFSPDTVTAAVGDIVEFHFYSNFHTVVQGDYSTPCSMGSLTGTGFNSGPINNTPSGTPDVFRVTINSTDPMWFYCSTPEHCQSGMSGVINPPSSGDSLATYQKNSQGTSTSEGSSTVVGGVVVAVGSSGSSASSSSAVAPTGSASSSAAAPASTASSTSATMVATTSTSALSVSSTSTPVSSAASVAASATTSKPSASATSSAGSPQGTLAVGGSALFSLAFGVGLVAFFMA